MTLAQFASVTSEQSRGLVYCITDDLAMFKIGMAKDVSRIANLQTSSSRPLRVVRIWLIESDMMRPAETFLHEKFKSERRQGEWFALDEHQVKWLLSLSANDLITEAIW